MKNTDDDVNVAIDDVTKAKDLGGPVTIGEAGRIGSRDDCPFVALRCTDMTVGESSPVSPVDVYL